MNGRLFMYAMPLPVKVSGVAVAGVSWSQRITSRPPITVTRQYLPVWSDFMIIVSPGRMGLEPLSGLARVNCSGTVMPVPLAGQAIGVVTEVTWQVSAWGQDIYWYTNRKNIASWLEGEAVGVGRRRHSGGVGQHQRRARAARHQRHPLCS
jgi:hypothetical protein